MPEIRLEGAAKYFKVEKRKIMAVKDIDVTIEQGEFVFLIGSSGAGKTTLLRLLGGDIPPDAGAAKLDGVNMNSFLGAKRFRLRRTFGYVWQEPQLLRKKTVYENLLVALAARSSARRLKPDQAIEKALSLVGLSGAQHHYPAELSIGEVRLVELARALVASPSVLLLDELTANLDDDNIWDVMYLLNELNSRGITIIMATHASRYVNIMRRRVLTLVDGRLYSDVLSDSYGNSSIKRGMADDLNKYINRIRVPSPSLAKPNKADENGADT